VRFIFSFEDKWVNHRDAAADFPSETLVPIDRSHVRLCKPLNCDDHPYVLLKEYLMLVPALQKELEAYERTKRQLEEEIDELTRLRQQIVKDGDIGVPLEVHGLPGHLDAVFKGLRLTSRIRYYEDRFERFVVHTVISADGSYAQTTQCTGRRVDKAGKTSFLETGIGSSVPLPTDLNPEATDLKTGHKLHVEVESVRNAYQREFRIWLRTAIEHDEGFAVQWRAGSRLDIDKSPNCLGFNLRSYGHPIGVLEFSMSFPFSPINVRLFAIFDSTNKATFVETIAPDDGELATTFTHQVVRPSGLHYFVVWDRLCASE
jgi:hypothetical protein